MIVFILSWLWVALIVIAILLSTFEAFEQLACNNDDRSIDQYHYVYCHDVDAFIVRLNLNQGEYQ